MENNPKIMHNGDHAEYEIANIGIPPEQRSDWPLPPFDASDWAKAFCKQFPEMDEGTALAWFAGALMRGFDEHASRTPTTPESDNQGDVELVAQLALLARAALKDGAPTIAMDYLNQIHAEWVVSEAVPDTTKPRKCAICGYDRNCLNCMANGDNHAAMFPARPEPLKATGEGVERVARALAHSHWEYTHWAEHDDESQNHPDAETYTDHRWKEWKEIAEFFIKTPQFGSLRPPVGVTNTQGEREAFEKWADEFGQLALDQLRRDITYPRLYADEEAQTAWEAWQHRAATNPAPCIKSDGEVERLRSVLQGVLEYTAENNPMQGCEDRDDARITAAFNALKSHPSNAMKE